MSLFLALCLLSRLAYSLNDIFTGRLARVYGGLEVATWRGVSLGFVMAPFLLWVPASAWAALAEHWGSLLAIVSITSVSNVMQLEAARHLPFGLRTALIITGIALCSAALGWLLLGERLSALELSLALVVVASSVGTASGMHSTHEIQPNIPAGSALAVGSALLMGVVALLVKQLAQDTNALLTAWAWEAGSGLVLVPILTYRNGAHLATGLARRFLKIGVASSPTAIGSGASVVALGLGELGLWASLAGTQVLFTAALGAWWHRERLGIRRWSYLMIAAIAVAALAYLRA